MKERVNAVAPWNSSLTTGLSKTNEKVINENTLAQLRKVSHQQIRRSENFFGTLQQTSLHLEGKEGLCHNQLHIVL